MNHSKNQLLLVILAVLVLPALSEQIQYGEGVINKIFPIPGIAIVPMPDFIS
jgi:hypothetical protein